ncbi:MAG: hypothetical protein P9M03_10215 [Candidatus Theseobacter exili]|nr:hypothetical protein [Candidatus Theseobacter exili]
MFFRLNRFVFNRNRDFSNDDVFFFIHIMKASGTSFRNMLWPLFQRKDIWPNRNNILTTRTNWYPPLNEIPVMDSKVGKRLRLIAGHYPFAASELFSKTPRYLVFLRHPVDRTVSFLKHARSNAPQYQGKSLREVYNDIKLRKHMICNYQTKQFSFNGIEEYYSFEKELVVDKERLGIAKKNLKKCDFVGLSEEFAKSIKLCEKIFGWEFKRILNDNISKDDVEIEDRLIEDIKKEVALDLEFYSFAVERFRDLTSEYSIG